MAATRIGQLMIVAVFGLFPSFAWARTWVDRTGKFRVEAKLERIYEDRVALRTTDGSLRTVPIDRLSDADQTYIRGLIEARRAHLAAQQAAAQQSARQETAAQPTAPAPDTAASAPADTTLLEKTARRQATESPAMKSTDPPEPAAQEVVSAAPESVTETAVAESVSPLGQGAAPASDSTATGAVATPAAVAADWNPAWITRLVVLVILGIIAYGFGIAVVFGAIGAGIAYGVCQGQNLPLAPTITASIALAYCAPAFLIILFSKPSALFGFLIFPAAPAVLVSHFALGTTWLWSSLDGAMIGLLLPVGIAMVAARNRARTTSTTSSVSTSAAPIPYTPSTSYSSSNSYLARSDAPEPRVRSEVRTRSEPPRIR